MPLAPICDVYESRQETGNEGQHQHIRKGHMMSISDPIGYFWMNAIQVLSLNKMNTRIEIRHFNYYIANISNQIYIRRIYHRPGGWS